MRTSKIWKRTTALIVLLAMILGSAVILGNALQPVSYADYFQHDIEKIRKSGDSVDMIIVGASRTLRTFVPEVFEEEMDLSCVINAASASQTICGSYYQLKELLEEFTPKYVVLGVVCNGFRNTGLQARLIVFDRLHGLNRWRFAWDSLEPEEWGYVLDLWRFRENLTRIGEIRRERKALEASDFAPDTEAEEYYAGKGFVYGNNAYATGTVPVKTLAPINMETDFPQESVEYMDKIVDLCAEKGIRLFLVSPPTTAMRLYTIPGYQEAVDYFETYAQEHDLSYHNLNYLLDRETYLADEYMHDFNHVNGEGAYWTSRQYAGILTKTLQGEETDSLFYPDLEAFKETVHRVVAVEGTFSEDGKHVSIRSFQNEGITPLYKVEIKEDTEDSYRTLVDWTTETELDLDVPENGPYRIRIRAKTGIKGDAAARQNYRFQ